MSNPLGQLSTSSALIFVGASILVHGGITSTRLSEAEPFIFVGCIIGLGALYYWFKSYGESRELLIDDLKDKAIEKAIDDHKKNTE